MRSFFQRICSLILALVVCITQYGCTTSITPPNSVLMDALELQIHITQRSLTDSLDLEDGSSQVLGVKIDSSDFVDYEEGRLLSVSGYVDYTLPGTEKISSPFQLFLERGEKGQSWRLARPSVSDNGLSKDWITYALPIKS